MRLMFEDKFAAYMDEHKVLRNDLNIRVDEWASKLIDAKHKEKMELKSKMKLKI